MVLTRNNDKPYFIMLIGLAGSGKSTLAKQIVIEHNGEKISPNIHSSDNLREEMFGNVNIQDKNEDLFKELHRRIKDDLKNGVDVVYDATNLNNRRRAAFLSELKKIDCQKEAVCVMTPWGVCSKQNKERDRTVPYMDMKKMYMHWTPPCVEEGFDHVSLAYHYGHKSIGDFDVKDLFKRIDTLNQDNSHHSLTLGAHCKHAASYIMEKYPNDERLALSALLHDNGKLFTKTRMNARGQDDGQSHYYQHHCVGAYDSMFYTAALGLPVEDRLHVALSIYYHMQPYTAWQQSEKALKRDMRIMPQAVFDDVQKIHEADVFAHNPEIEELHPDIDKLIENTIGEIEEYGFVIE